MATERNIDEFNHDVESNDGYLYSNTDKLSCQLANKRLSDAVIQMTNITKKKVIDIGCGDGTYTMELYAQKPAYLLGVDAAESAIECARKKSQDFDNIHFEVGDIYNLDNDVRFDVAIVRGVLHHLDDVERAISSISKIADEIIIIEPNGYNPVLKVIEKTSKYHIEHDEKSYFPHSLDRWFNKNGGKVIKSKYCGLVPMFCPDAMAKFLKKIEPIIESVFLLRQLSCAVYVQKIVFESRSKV
jgi:2-polyprenyl-3-methyl-5-hydroxy-6-metoxy-1,4-benzoquinol methylase